MGKSVAERKAASRIRQALAGIEKIELHLDSQEVAMLNDARSARRPGRTPYEISEYIALLIRQDYARVQNKIKSLSRRRCGKCGDRLPVKSCALVGESACWLSLGWHETKLTL